LAPGPLVVESSTEHVHRAGDGVLNPRHTTRFKPADRFGSAGGTRFRKSGSAHFRQRDPPGWYRTIDV
jgi:hypothetical protein